MYKNNLVQIRAGHVFLNFTEGGSVSANVTEFFKLLKKKQSTILFGETLFSVFPLVALPIPLCSMTFSFSVFIIQIVMVKPSTPQIRVQRPCKERFEKW